MRRVFLAIALSIVVIGVYAVVAGRGAFGSRQDGGKIATAPRDPARVAERHQRQSDVFPGHDAKQIVFGDLHAHTTFSFDAFSISLPMYRGEGSHPPADACDFARFCSGLDFWSINDHAESLTPHQWAETKDVVRQCNAVAGDASNPDLVTFLGWEWTQIGRTPETHYGHKNVVFRGIAEAEVPTRPIASREQLFPGEDDPYTLPIRLLYIATGQGDRGRQPYHDFARFMQDRQDVPPCPADTGVHDLPPDCSEMAATPTALFDKLDDWDFPYLVIPHGNTWGFYTPALSSWDKQLAGHRNPDRHEYLIEVFSGHGNIESYRPWRALTVNAAGEFVCPEPSDGYLPECWRAGEIIRERCLGLGFEANECEARAVVARANAVEGRDAGYLTVQGSKVEDWLEAGQCTDCYMPAYNHRPGGSVQYALALRDFTDPDAPKRFRFGMLGSSDIHSARPGTGYKEGQRMRMTDAALGQLGPPPIIRKTEPLAASVPIAEAGPASPYFERFASFFGAGGLVGAHSTGRDRDAIWESLERKEVYGTSGDRILLWFDLVGDDSVTRPMGSSVSQITEPAFEVRAVGAFGQRPGCPDDATTALGTERLDHLCGGECFHPGDHRKLIERIEIVRIRPQQSPGEAIEDLIDDPWRVYPCPANEDGCRVRFSDPEFVADARDSVYYVRAIQAPSPTVNGNNLRCRRDEFGACIAVEPCRASSPTEDSDDCLATLSERAWSSPIFVDWGEPVTTSSEGDAIPSSS